MKRRPFNPYKYGSEISYLLDVAEMAENFEKPQTVFDRNKDLAVQLELLGRASLATVLLECGVRSTGRTIFRCLQPCCHICMRALRRWYCWRAWRLQSYYRQRLGTFGTHVTVLPEGMSCPLNQFDVRKLRNWKHTIWREIESVDVEVPLIGSIDLLIKRQAYTQVPTVDFHLHLYCPLQQGDRFYRVLKKRPHLKKPFAVVCKDFDHRNRLSRLSYTFKRLFEQQEVCGYKHRLNDRYDAMVSSALEGSTLVDRMFLIRARREKSWLKYPEVEHSWRHAE